MIKFRLFLIVAVCFTQGVFMATPPEAPADPFDFNKFLSSENVRRFSSTVASTTASILPIINYLSGKNDTKLSEKPVDLIKSSESFLSKKLRQTSFIAAPVAIIAHHLAHKNSIDLGIFEHGLHLIPLALAVASRSVDVDEDTPERCNKDWFITHVVKIEALMLFTWLICESIDEKDRANLQADIKGYLAKIQGAVKLS